MKKVLFIAYLYPPIANSGTRRSLEFANYLPDFGWTPVVLTLANPEPKFCDASLLDEVRSGTRIERVPLGSKVIAERIADVFGMFFDRNRIAEGCEWRIQNLLRVPDECSTWRMTATRRAEEICREEGFDVIYASGWPWTSFLIAADVSRRTGRPCVIDYRDLWKGSDAAWDKRTPLQRWLSPYLEKKVLRKASAVVSTTPSFVRTLEESGCKGKAHCITNGFDPNDFVRLSEPEAVEENKFVRIVYTGVWRPDYGPDDLYSAVRQLKERNARCLQSLKVMVAGSQPGRAREFGIDDLVEEFGPVSHDRAVDLMMRASVLYLPVSKGRYEKWSVPGKLFEYLGSGRPILASVPEDSEVAGILESVGGARCIVPGNVQELADLVESLCNNQGSDNVFSARNPEATAEYTRSNTTKKLAALFDSVVQNRS